MSPYIAILQSGDLCVCLGGIPGAVRKETREERPEFSSRKGRFKIFYSCDVGHYQTAEGPRFTFRGERHRDREWHNRTRFQVVFR